MKIDSFQGQFRWLSNFWPVDVTYNGIRFSSVEHAYQAAKTKDAAQQRAIALLTRPGEAKRAGKLLTVRADWDDLKVPVMRDLIDQKFRRPDLKAKLLETGNAEIVEGNTWNDTFWGICQGVGENNLGKLIMEIRQGHSMRVGGNA